MTCKRTHTTRFLTIALVIAFLFTACACTAGQQPKNIIFIIGDGMGIGAITAARCAKSGENGKLVLDTMPVIGLAKTHSEDHLVTDSAASGTALATGHKTLNGRIAMDSQGRSLLTLLELATRIGKSAGVVTTDTITGATPAVFYSHVDNRGKSEEIATQLIVSNAIVAMGSDRKSFLPASEGVEGRKDGRDLTAEAAKNGFGVVFDAKEMEASKSEKLIGLFVFDDSGPTFKAMTDKAVSMLAKNPNGFFLMAESCLPDKGGHKNDIATVVKGVLDLDVALNSALNFAAKDGNTLVIVTADHETGGLCVLNKNEKNPRGVPGWLCGNHTGNMVIIHAYGPGAERFSGTFDNTQIPKIMAELWGTSLK